MVEDECSAADAQAFSEGTQLRKSQKKQLAAEMQTFFKTLSDSVLRRSPAASSLSSLSPPGKKVNHRSSQQKTQSICSFLKQAFED